MREIERENLKKIQKPRDKFCEILRAYLFVY